jgi:hypothetical protein
MKILATFSRAGVEADRQAHVSCGSLASERPSALVRCSKAADLEMT